MPTNHADERNCCGQETRGLAISGGGENVFERNGSYGGWAIFGNVVFAASLDPNGCYGGEQQYADRFQRTLRGECSRKW